MDDNSIMQKVSDEALAAISSGGINGYDDEMRRYAAWFKRKGYSLSDTQYYYVQHMRNGNITCMTENEAKSFLASVY